MTLRIKIEVPANGGPYEAQVSQSNGNPAAILTPGESIELYVHGGNAIHVTELPAGTKLMKASGADAAAITGAPALQPHEQRVIDEKRDLDEKLSKLRAFMASPVFAAMDVTSQRLLQSQAVAMDGYSSTLRRRIERFMPAEDFHLGKACDLSNDTGCEACQ